MARKKTTKRRGKGEGGIHRQGDRWVAQVTAGYELRPDGTKKQIRKAVSGATKQEVLDKLAELQNKKKAGNLVHASMTVGELLTSWLDTVIDHRTDPRTARDKRQKVRDYLLPHLGFYQLAALKREHVSELYHRLKEKGHSPDLCNKVGQLLRQALAYAVEEGYLPHNVAKKVSLPKVENNEIHPLTQEQARQLLAAAGKGQTYLLLLLALDSGMRQGELLALEWSDLDLKKGTAQVKRTVRTDEKGGPRVKEVKTQAARRTIQLACKTVEALKAHRERVKGRLVFPARKKGPFDSPDRYLNKRNVQTAFKRCLKRAGLPAFRFHDLRHTCATLLYQATKNVQAVSKRLGHRDIVITLRTYAHFLPQMQAEIVGAMNDILDF